MKTLPRLLLFATVTLIGGTSLLASPLLDPYYSSYYTLANLGAVPGATNYYGGLTFLAGDTNTLLIGTHANYPDAVIDQVAVVRDGDGHITGFSGTASTYASAPNIDSGLEYGPGGVLFFTQYYLNQIGQLKPGSTTPDKILVTAGSGSVGNLQFVPTGFPGAGDMALVDYQTGVFSLVTLSPDGSGTYDLGPVINSITLPNGPEGVLYVPAGTSRFPDPSILVAEYSTGTIAAYELDANGLPVLASRRVFLSGMDVTVGIAGGPEGAKVDPVTNDFLFTTYDGSEVFRLSANPVPEPGTLSMVALALAGVFFARRGTGRSA